MTGTESWERRDAVAHRIDHQLKRRIDGRARLLRIEILLELGGSLDVREHRGVLRSLSKFSRAAMSATGIGESFDFFAVVAAVAPMVAPHSPQKSSLGSLEAPHLGQERSSDVPHFEQNLGPSRFSFPHFVQRMSAAGLSLRFQFLEQRLGVLQIRGVEALGEPVVDRRGQSILKIIAVRYKSVPPEGRYRSKRPKVRDAMNCPT